MLHDTFTNKTLTHLQGEPRWFGRSCATYVGRWQDDCFTTFFVHLVGFGCIWDALRVIGDMQQQSKAVVLEQSHPVTDDIRLLTQSDLAVALSQAAPVQLGTQRLLCRGDLDELKGKLKGELKDLKGDFAFVKILLMV